MVSAAKNVAIFVQTMLPLVSHNYRARYCLVQLTPLSKLYFFVLVSVLVVFERCMNRLELNVHASVISTSDKCVIW